MKYERRYIRQGAESSQRYLENTETTFEQTEDDLSALGMDSIVFIRVVVALEEAFDIEIPDEYLL